MHDVLERPKVLQWFLRKGADLVEESSAVLASPSVGLPLHEAITQNHPLKSIKLLLGYGAGKRISNALHAAVRSTPSVEIINLLVEDNVFLDNYEWDAHPAMNQIAEEAGFEQATAYHLANLLGKHDIADLLASHGADTSKRLKSKSRGLAGRLANGASTNHLRDSHNIPISTPQREPSTMNPPQRTRAVVALDLPSAVTLPSNS